MEEQAVERLKAKSPEEAIIERIGRDLNLWWPKTLIRP